MSAAGAARQRVEHGGLEGEMVDFGADAGLRKKLTVAWKLRHHEVVDRQSLAARTARCRPCRTRSACRCS